MKKIVIFIFLLFIQQSYSEVIIFNNINYEIIKKILNSIIDLDEYKNKPRQILKYIDFDIDKVVGYGKPLVVNVEYKHNAINCLTELNINEENSNPYTNEISEIITKISFSYNKNSKLSKISVTKIWSDNHENTIFNFYYENNIIKIIEGDYKFYFIINNMRIMEEKLIYKDEIVEHYKYIYNKDNIKMVDIKNNYKEFIYKNDFNKDKSNKIEHEIIETSEAIARYDEYLNEYDEHGRIIKHFLIHYNLRSNYKEFSSWNVYKEYIYEDIIEKSLKLYGKMFTPKIDVLRFRESPSLNGKYIRTLKKDEKLELLETGKEETIDGIKGYWIKVKTEQGETGWCFDGYLEEVKE